MTDFDKAPTRLISIHALREEGDKDGAITGFDDFISIHALREEGDLERNADRLKRYEISIHALREEGDSCGLRCIAPTAISIHALREEGDHEFCGSHAAVV